MKPASGLQEPVVRAFSLPTDPERLPCARQCTGLRVNGKVTAAVPEGLSVCRADRSPLCAAAGIQGGLCGTPRPAGQTPEVTERKGLRAREDARVTPLLTASPAGSRGRHTAGCGSGGHTPTCPIRQCPQASIVDHAGCCCVAATGRHPMSETAPCHRSGFGGQFREYCKVRHSTSNTLQACALQLGPAYLVLVLETPSCLLPPSIP